MRWDVDYRRARDIRNTLFYASLNWIMNDVLIIKKFLCVTAVAVCTNRTTPLEKYFRKKKIHDDFIKSFSTHEVIEKFNSYKYLKRILFVAFPDGSVIQHSWMSSLNFFHFFIWFIFWHTSMSRILSVTCSNASGMNL